MHHLPRVAVQASVTPYTSTTSSSKAIAMLKALGLCLGGRGVGNGVDKGVQSFDRSDEVERLLAELEEAKVSNDVSPFAMTRR